MLAPLTVWFIIIYIFYDDIFDRVSLSTVVAFTIVTVLFSFLDVLHTHRDGDIKP